MKVVVLAHAATAVLAVQSSMGKMFKRGMNAVKSNMSPQDYEFQDLTVTDHIKADFIGGPGLWKEHQGKITIPQCANFGMHEQDEFVVVAEADDLEEMSQAHV